VVTPCEPWRWYVSQPRCAYRCMQHDVNYVCLPPPPPTVVAGYQYRLCPLTDTLDEDCFKRTPVPFAKKTWLMWGDGSRMAINGTYLSEGTEPALSTWAMNPLPYSDSHDAVQFPAPCHETVDRTLNDTGRCSGRFPYAVSIVDALVVPADLVPGSYVLGFRYDCEVRAGQRVLCCSPCLFAHVASFFFYGDRGSTSESRACSKASAQVRFGRKEKQTCLLRRRVSTERVVLHPGCRATALSSPVSQYLTHPARIAGLVIVC
jgi:hypothetical protein